MITFDIFDQYLRFNVMPTRLNHKRAFKTVAIYDFNNTENEEDVR